MKERKRDLRIDYSAPATPDGYTCDGCGVRHVKLWREYQTVASLTRLLCADCAEVDQRKSHTKDGEPEWTSLYSQGRGDQIGWLIPAVPTQGGETFWGYTSVPDAGCRWWKALPARVSP